MDPGDWADQHVLLNESFYNNPTEAIPKRMFSFVTRLDLSENWYAGAGVHDANGKDNHIDFGQVWDTQELFTWAEFGFKRPGAAFGESTHVHYWHQDERVEAGVMDSWGLTFSSSYVSEHDIKTIMRIGYSEGDAAQMRRFVGVATSLSARGSDRILFGAGWGSPPDKSLRDQTTLEVMYRAQLTQNIVVSPDLQVTFNPSFNTEKDKVHIYGLRFRFTF
jgi:porin